MEMNLVIKSKELNKEDLRALLQAIRDCEMANFKEKKIFVSAEVPDMRSEDMAEVLTNITPPYDYGPVIFKYGETETEFMARQSGEVQPGTLKAAMERYPGYPLPLALSKYMIDLAFDKNPVPPLIAGLGWGGVHLEHVGSLVQRLVDAMYHQSKKAMAIVLQATDFPDSYDHIWIEVKDVDSGTEEEIQRMRLGGWPCCACDKTIEGKDNDSAWVMLQKRATWEHPTWGNVLYGTKGGAVASLCGICANAGMKPLYAVKKDGEKFTRVPMSELEDMI